MREITLGPGLGEPCQVALKADRSTAGEAGNELFMSGRVVNTFDTRGGYRLQIEDGDGQLVTARINRQGILVQAR